MEIIDYREKYLKYKQKYLQLKGGAKEYYLPCEICHYTKSIYTRDTNDLDFNVNVCNILFRELTRLGIGLYTDNKNVICSTE